MLLHTKAFRVALATIALALLVFSYPRQSFATSGYEFNISFSEAMLAAYGTPDEAQVAHYEGWDSAIARIRKRNMPFIQITNTSTSPTPLTQFTMTVGKQLYNFSDDILTSYAKLGTTTPGVSLTSSALDNGDTLVVDFTNGLQPGETVRFQVDIDVDAGNPDVYPYPDYRMVFFDVNSTVNDTSDNSVLTAHFMNQNGGTSSQSQVLPDFDQGGPLYLNGDPLRSYNDMDGVEMFELNGEIPEPGAAMLALTTLAAAAGYRRRRG